MVEVLEQEPSFKDISAEFLTKDVFSFLDFLRTLKKEPGLSIITDWQGVGATRRLKAFLEMAPSGQKRKAAIRATEKERKQELNVFAPGVKWIPR